MFGDPPSLEGLRSMLRPSAEPTTNARSADVVVVRGSMLLTTPTKFESLGCAMTPFPPHTRLVSWNQFRHGRIGICI